METHPPKIRALILILSLVLASCAARTASDDIRRGHLFVLRPSGDGFVVVVEPGGSIEEAKKQIGCGICATSPIPVTVYYVEKLAK